MKTLSEIRQELSSALRQCEDFRIKKATQYRNGVLLTIGGIALGCLSIFLGIGGFLAFYVIGIIFLIGSLVVFFLVASKNKKDYESHFKSNILKQIIENMMPSVSYQAQGGINKTDFNSSMLFSTNHNIYDAEDYFKGNYNGINFEMSELNVKRRSSNVTYSNGQARTNTTTTNIFKGLFIVIDSSKNSYSETYVLPDSAEKMFGSIGKFFQKNIGSLVHRGSMIYFENYPEFEKHFVVYGTEEIETQRLMSDNLVQSIMDIYGRWKILPSFAFIQDKVYVAVPISRNLLKVSLHKSLIDEHEEILKCYIDEIALSMSIIEELSEDFK